MSERSKIIIVGCADYSDIALGKAFERIEALAHLNKIALPSGSKIVLKPNLLAPDPPEKATTTHPEVFRYAARLFKKGNNELFYGDSPGISDLVTAAKVSGIADCANAEGAEALDFSKERSVEFSNGISCKRFTIADCLLPEHKIVNLPKLKTHGQMIYTGAIKNIFGCVPGIRKPESHLRMHDADHFAMMIADLYRMIGPAFTIMDAVVGMEGNGPRGGEPRKLGFLIAGADCLAIDSISARIIGLDPASLPILKYAHKFGAGNIDLDEIEIIGDDWRSFCVEDFKNISSPAALNFANRAITGVFKKFLMNRPAVDHKKCILCMKCVGECPVKGKAIQHKRGRIRYNYRKCIRCYCCQEICPEGAIHVQENIWWKILSIFFNQLNKRTK